MTVSIYEEDYIKNLLPSLIDYAKANIGTAVLVRGKKYNITYSYDFPKLTQNLKDILPCLIFQHVDMFHSADWGMGNYKTIRSTVQIWGYGGNGDSNDVINEQLRILLMSLVSKYFTDKYSIDYKEGITAKGKLKTTCTIKRLEPTSNNLVDRYRFLATLIVDLPYLRKGDNEVVAQITSKDQIADGLIDASKIDTSSFMTLSGLTIADDLYVNGKGTFYKDIEVKGGAAISGLLQGDTLKSYNPILAPNIKTPYYPLGRPKVLNLIGTDPELKRFFTSETDGDYLYLAPTFTNGVSGKVVRIDLTDFSTVSTLNLIEVDPALKSFSSSFSDGRYIYLSPNSYNDVSGKLVRINTQDFTVTGVSVLNLIGIDQELKNFNTAVTDGRYGYLLPSNLNGSSGKIARIDLDNFSTVDILELQITDGSLRNSVASYCDGNYLYAAFLYPYNSSGTIARINLSDFETVDRINMIDINNKHKDFYSIAGDGRYIYFGGWYTNGWSGEIIRIDAENFSTSSAVVLPLVNTDPDIRMIYNMKIDKHYLYVPPYTSNGVSGKMARIDLNDFSTVDTHTLMNDDIEFKNFQTSCIAGKNIYFAPTNNNGVSGKLIKFNLF